MSNRTRYRQWRIYSELWRTFYAIIIIGCGGSMAYYGIRAGDFLFAAGVGVLTIVAAVVLYARTYRRTRRRAAVTSGVRRARR